MRRPPVAGRHGRRMPPSHRADDEQREHGGQPTAMPGNRRTNARLLLASYASLAGGTRCTVAGGTGGRA